MYINKKLHTSSRFARLRAVSKLSTFLLYILHIYIAILTGPYDRLEIVYETLDNRITKVEFNNNVMFLKLMHYTRKNAQVCKQVVTSLFTSCQQIVFALLVSSLSRQVWSKLLTTCNKLDDIIRLVTRLF